jgi:hypothetical protein
MASHPSRAASAQIELTSILDDVSRVPATVDKNSDFITVTSSPKRSASQGPQSVELSQSQNGDVVEPSPVVLAQQQRAFMIQFTSICVALALSGWNDASTGPLLPRMQLVYDVCP